jgi:hypothetical protein
MAKKRNKPIPRRKRMNRASRLQSAKSTQWVEKYTGKNIVRGYCKCYAVDPLCAVLELRELGVSTSAEQEENLRRSAINKSLARNQKPQEEEIDPFSNADDTFAYIAGCTPGGVPYGVTWEEMGETPPWMREDQSKRADSGGPC